MIYVFQSQNFLKKFKSFEVFLIFLRNLLHTFIGNKFYRLYFLIFLDFSSQYFDFFSLWIGFTGLFEA